jgi:acetyl-CoA acyltransferase
MPTPVVAAACRTPQGTDGGALADVRAEELSVAVVHDLLSRTGVEPDAVEDLLWGCAQQRSEQDSNVARVIALVSELGESTPATTINRWCASSMQALASAADAVAAGRRDCLIAGGVESMSRVPMSSMPYGELHPRLSELYNVGELQMGMTAEAVASEYGVSREAQDEYALRSHERAAAATDSGRFEDELVPVETADGTLAEDEGIRRDTSLEALADLTPAFAGDGTVTAGNASQVSDGAAGLLVTSEAFADERGLPVLARVGAHDVAGVDPTVMGIGPVPATRRLLNEAFASQCVHSRRELDVDEDRFNVNGGAIALGHPLGASGARLPVTLVHEMEKRDVERGLATLCVGFGQGMAIELAR